jgi:2-(1,2-epoxy-1,2-dihydrophenyl)acetyl-CoA isomerase
MIKQYPHVETERQGPVLIIRLANQSARNAFSRDMRFSLRDITREVQDDHSIRTLYLTAKGPTFCAGGDLQMLSLASEPWAVHRRFSHATGIFPSFLALDRPTVCGVRGQAIGGGLGLALLSDLIVAGDSAKFTAGFFRLGVVPDCLTLFTLPRLVGLAKARNFIYNNGTWDASTAVELGIAVKSVPDAEVDAEGLALAHSLASGPAEVMGIAKQLLLKSFESSMAEMWDGERLNQVLAMSSAEFHEGLEALKAKRDPDFIAASKSNALFDGMPSSDSDTPAK